MDYQWILNIVFACLGWLAAYVLVGLRDSQKRTDSNYAELGNKVQKIEVLVAGQYVTKTEMVQFMKTLTEQLRRIEDKQDNAPCKKGQFK